MKNIILTAIRAGGYKLEDMRRTIAKMYTIGSITAEDMDELLVLATQNAHAGAERPDVIELLAKLKECVESLEKRIRVLEGGEVDEEGETTEYHAWEPWDGISDKYQPGAIVSHNGDLWMNNHNGQNVWEPGVIGTELLWVRYDPEFEEVV